MTYDTLLPNPAQARRMTRLEALRAHIAQAGQAGIDWNDLLHWDMREHSIAMQTAQQDLADLTAIYRWGRSLFGHVTITEAGTRATGEAK